MSEIRWHQALEDITKVEYKYNIKNPLWDSEGWKGVFKEYGFVPVDAKGEWWTRIPGSPEIPIMFAPLVTTSATTSGAIAGTSATALIETATPIIDVTYTEVAGGATASVTTGGAVTSVSSAVATGAIGAAIGFGVGLGGFELAPEFWTRVSNAVFGTDLDPNKIGEMTRDTNALVVIKDGIGYMAKDMINAIRNAFFDNGAADETISYPQESGQEVNVTINTWGGNILSWGDVKALFPYDADWSNEAELKALFDQLSEYNGYSFWRYTDFAGEANNELFIVVYDTQESLPVDYTFSKNTNTGLYYTTSTYNSGPGIEFYLTYHYSLHSMSGSINRTGSRTIKYGIGKSTYGKNTEAHSINTTRSYGVDGVTPTGEQGTKDQPLEELYPDWVSKGIKTIAGDGETKVDWLPVSIPDNDPIVEGNPFTTEKAQEGILPDEDTETLGQIADNTQEITKDAPVSPTPPITPEPVITPTPEAPVISGGGGSATGLANLYNPTLAQVKEFSRWLWGSDGLNLDQLKKLLQDPMQAIIGLHVMYATPTTGANRDIQVGYINSGVQSKIVTEQYTEIDCGTVTINEYFGDARDYSPYTQVYCYLPFIGIVELNADDVVNSTLGIKYKIDVLTGCCLAQLTVKKYGLDAVLYTYTGNCAVQMPITSGNYLSTVSSLLGVVVSGAAAVATGGALAPVAIGAAANAMGGGARASVAMSGSLGSNAGAMGIRKPYLIIKRVESADANGYNEFYGYPTNKRVNLSQLTGYVRVKEINLSGTNATEDEQNEIVTLLKEGVIL